MGNKKASRPPVSKTSSAASPAVAGATLSGNKTSVLRAAFSPSEYQLALFASVIQGLDAQHIRIHDTNTGRLVCEHAVAPKESITSLDWGFYHSDKPREQQSKKKRKRSSGINGAVDGLDNGDIVVAFGTSSSEIRMYSPSEDKIVGTLSGGHDRGIKDFKFTAKRPGLEGWSIGGDNKLVQWDLRTGQSIRTIHLPASSVVSALSRPVPSNPPVICASQTPYIIDVEKAGDPPVSFSAMRNPIHTIIPSSTDDSVLSGQFLASDTDRYINVFDAQKQKLVMNLVAEKEVTSLSFYPGTDAHNQKPADDESLVLEKQVLAVVTDDGTIELFTRPFVQNESKSSTSLKAKVKQLTRRADASIKVVRPDKSRSLVPVVTTSFQGPDLVIAWAEGGVNVIFERVRWQDEESDELAFRGTKEVVRTKSASVLGSATVNGVQESSKSHVDESKAVVEEGQLVEDIEMDDSRQDVVSISSDEEGDEDEEARDAKKYSEKQQSGKQRDADKDVEMQDAGDSEAEQEDEEAGEPSFGELLRANASEQPIDVEAELDDEAGRGALLPSKSNAGALQSGVSLSTVLTQALKTNDSAMLESCFHTGDLSIVRTTIQRLDSSLAATLLQRLAERLSARPGRYGHLLVWVQWTCVAHGGAIAGKADILKRMTTLFRVMEQRSSSLPSLLLLKGKLDMLDAQLSLRQSIANRNADGDSEDDDDVIYVEGQDDEEDEEDNQLSDEDEVMMNGVAGSESENEEGSEDEEENEEGILDVEAEESAGSSDAEESLEEDEDEEDEDEDSAGSMVDFIADTEDEGESDDAAVAQPPPSKKAKLRGSRKGKGKSGRK